MTLGLVVWVISAVLSGLASGFYMLAFARVLSGVGEAR
jgi:predicted MFS family arabinose efflux permease